MYARAVQQLPEGKDWLYEVKFDGYRCLAGRDSTGVTLWSRRANRFTDQFPTIAEACEHLPLKPELVAQVEFTEWTPDGHLRHSRFVGLRDDKDPGEVVRDE
jgi:ATP-dependent DNA ligase